MAFNNPFLNWLDGVQCKSGLINSYYYACIAENECGQEQDSSGFGFNILDEIEKENYGSDPTLRILFTRALKIAQPEKDINLDNHMDALREFVASLYSGKAETNRRETGKTIPYKRQFEQLSPEVKMWIFHSLLQYSSRITRQPKPIGRDSTGNLYFIANKSMLYVQYGTKLQEMTRGEEDKKWTKLERRLNTMPRWKLLADSKDNWAQISMLLESFDEEEIANRINEELKEPASKDVVTQAQEEPTIEEGRDSDTDGFQRAIPKRKSRTQLKKPPGVRWADDERPSTEFQPQNAPENHRGESDASSQDSYLQREHSVNSSERPKTIRCMYFPNCKRSAEECHFIHPQFKCNNFGRPACPGLFCRFLHPPCPEDGRCENNQCTYEHYKTIPSLRRIQYAKMKEGSQSSEWNRQGEESRRVPSAGKRDEFVERVRESFDNNLRLSDRSKHSESSPVGTSKEQERILSPAHNERPFSNKELRCHYFPRCNKPAEKCSYAHPRDHCASFPNCVRRRDCPFLHGPCPNDRGCKDEYCIFEHYQQIPPRASINYYRSLQQKREGQI